MPNQLLVADQQLGFVMGYLPEPAGQVGRRIVQEGPNLETQDLIVKPGQDIQMVKLIEVAFSLVRRKIGHGEVLAWQYDGDLHVDDWLDKDPAKLGQIFKSACNALDLEVHAVSTDRATVSAYFGKGTKYCLGSDVTALNNHDTTRVEPNHPRRVAALIAKHPALGEVWISTHVHRMGSATALRCSTIGSPYFHEPGTRVLALDLHCREAIGTADYSVDRAVATLPTAAASASSEQAELPA